MIVNENHCVDCDVCYNCGRKSWDVHKCDAYKCEHYAQYYIDNEDYCEDCLEKILETLFKQLSLKEKIEALKEHISVNKITIGG